MNIDLSNEFKHKFNDVFYNKVTPVLNKIAGLNPRDQFSVGLFLNLGVKFEIKFDDNIPNETQPSKNISDEVSFFMKRIGAYVELMGENFTKESSVVITVTARDESDAEVMFGLFNKIEISGILAFIYLHEVQHIIRKHNTRSFNSLMNKVVINHKGEDYFSSIRKNDLFKIFNIAEDYAINYALVELISDGDSSMKLLGGLIKSSGALYNSNYGGMSELDILKEILDNSKIIDNIGYQGVGEDGALGKTIEGDGHRMSGDVNDREVSSLADAIKAEVGKHTGKSGFKMEGLVEESVKVDVLWFDKLSQGFFNLVNKKTKHSIAKWSGLDNKMRHIYKSPIRKNIEKSVDLIVSVDQSGSISYESLGRLLYLFEERSSKISGLTLLFHDTEVVHVDQFTGEFNPKLILNAVKKRHCGGGTSHDDVFSWMDNNLSLRDIKNKIYISFSDNYSDIEEVYHGHSSIKAISKIWLNSDGRSVDNSIPGLKIGFS